MTDYNPIGRKPFRCLIFNLGDFAVNVLADVQTRADLMFLALKGSNLNEILLKVTEIENEECD